MKGASRRDIAAAVAAEIERGDLWRAADFYESNRYPKVTSYGIWSISTVAGFYHVRVADLERVLRGRKASR